MAVQMPPLLKDSTGQEIKQAIQGLTPVIPDFISDAFSVERSYSKGDITIYNNNVYEFTANKSAGAWDSTKVTQTTIGAVCTSLSNSLTQLPPNITFGTPQVLTWTNDKETFATAGYLTGYVRKSANATAGLLGVTSNKVPNGDFRMIKNFYNASEYQDFNMLVCKGEELTITTKTEVTTIHVIFLPFANMS